MKKNIVEILIFINEIVCWIC